MPIYEYKCEKCGHKFDLMQKMGETGTQKCESCGELQAQRIVSQTSFMLKGDGWYATDYAGKKAHASSDSTSSDADPPCKSGGCGSGNCPVAS